jgi:hypothetical protein
MAGANDLDDADFASGDVAVVPDVWAPAQPDPALLDPTPMYLPSPLDSDQQQSDLFIDTMPGNAPDSDDTGFDPLDDDDNRSTSR